MVGGAGQWDGKGAGETTERPWEGCAHCCALHKRHNCTCTVPHTHTHLAPASPPLPPPLTGGALSWPIFKWAGGKDDTYFARMDKNAIKVYQAPDMGQLDKRPVKLDGVQDFLWSPSEAIISAYTAEQGNLPARIVLVKIPERTEIRQKNLFSVSGECWCHAFCVA